MDDLTILAAFDAGGDVLEVHATHPSITDAGGTPVPLVARGWVSALTNHYPPEAYRSPGAMETRTDGDGRRVEVSVAGRLKPDAHARPMTPDESGAYLKGLFAPQLALHAPSPAVGPRRLDLAALGVAKGG